MPRCEGMCLSRLRQKEYDFHEIRNARNRRMHAVAGAFRGAAAAVFTQALRLQTSAQALSPAQAVPAKQTVSPDRAIPAGYMSAAQAVPAAHALSATGLCARRAAGQGGQSVQPLRMRDGTFEH